MYRGKEVPVRKQGASKYKRKAHLLRNVGKKEDISTPKIDKQIEGVPTSWRRQAEE